MNRRPRNVRHPVPETAWALWCGEGGFATDAPA